MPALAMAVPLQRQDDRGTPGPEVLAPSCGVTQTPAGKECQSKCPEPLSSFWALCLFSVLQAARSKGSLMNAVTEVNPILSLLLSPFPSFSIRPFWCPTAPSSCEVSSADNPHRNPSWLSQSTRGRLWAPPETSRDFPALIDFAAPWLQTQARLIVPVLQGRSLIWVPKLNLAAVSHSASSSVSEKPGTPQLELYQAKAKQGLQMLQSIIQSPSLQGPAPLRATINAQG